MVKPFITVDCETDPFQYGRIPKPFIWGAFDGNQQYYFEGENCTQKFVDWLRPRDVFAYAHNGGKFDFMFLLEFLDTTTVKIINGRLVQVQIGMAKLRDSFSIIPEPLAAYQKTKIDYTKFEDHCRHHYMAEIKEYLADDCVYLFDLVKAFKERAGHGLTIAGTALTFARKIGIPVVKTNKKHDDRFRLFYFGGRCEAFAGGKFNNIDIFDIKSAYPYAMWHNHPTGKEFIDHNINRNTKINKNISRNKSKSKSKSKSSSFPVDKYIEGVSNITQCFIKIECYSRGAFPLRDKHSLRFPHDYNVFHISGWEYKAAIDNGLIDFKRQCIIHECYEFYNSIEFRNYIRHWFEEKQTAEKSGDKLQRLIAKRMLNSLYGKFAQNPVEYRDYKIMRAGSELIDGWQLGQEFANKEFHWRPTLWALQQKYGEDWHIRNTFYNVATAASITGLVRAMLVETIARLGWDKVLYCDTDSVMCRPADYSLLRRDGKIGSWEHEGRASTLHIAGRKLYAANIINSDGTETIKKATKGARLTADEIRRIAMGETIKWQNEAPTFSIDGGARFIVRSLKRTV